MDINTNIKVLVVDDFSAMREVIRNILSQIGINNVDEADDGVTALPKIRKNIYDLILLDWNMPQMNGLDLLEAIRSEPDIQDVPVIMVSTKTLQDKLDTTTSASVKGFLIKPFTAAGLEEKLRDIFNGK